MNIPIPLDYLKSAKRWFGRSPEQLGRAEARALELAARREALAEDPNLMLDERATLGERLADRVAAYGGSWGFISLFGMFLLAWALLNTEVLGKTAFDPYPYIFLNLVLSMLAAIQAPVIMMSQSRLSTRDRQMAAHDYQVNLKAEIEIMALHEKVDSMRTEQLVSVVAHQQQQIALLTQLLEAIQSPKRTGPESNLDQ